MASLTPSRYVAQEGVASSPDASILGSVLQALVANVRAEEMRPMLQKYGLKTIEPDEWYPQQLVLDFEVAVARSEMNATDNLVAIGMKAVDTIPFPPNVNTIEAAVDVLNVIMAQIFRNVPDDERFLIQVSRPGYLLVSANMPYPADILYGYLWALAKRFRPDGTNFRVTAVANQNPQEYPGSAYEITWK